MSNRCVDLNSAQMKTELPDSPELRAPHPTHQEGSMAKEDFNKTFKDATGSDKKADALLEQHFDKGNGPAIVTDDLKQEGGGGGHPGRRGAAGDSDKSSGPSGKGERAHGEKIDRPGVINI